MKEPTKLRTAACLISVRRSPCACTNTQTHTIRAATRTAVPAAATCTPRARGGRFQRPEQHRFVVGDPAAWAHRLPPFAGFCDGAGGAFPVGAGRIGLGIRLGHQVWRPVSRHGLAVADWPAVVWLTQHGEPVNLVDGSSDFSKSTRTEAVMRRCLVPVPRCPCSRISISASVRCRRQHGTVRRQVLSHECGVVLTLVIRN